MNRRRYVRLAHVVVLAPLLLLLPALTWSQTTATVERVTDYQSQERSGWIVDIQDAGNFAVVLVNRFIPHLRTTQSELWRTDGTTAGTQLIRRFSDNLGKAVTLQSAGQGRAYFMVGTVKTADPRFANSTCEQCQVWFTDGTEEKTYRLARHQSVILHRSQLLNRMLIYVTNTGIWRSSGTPETTRRIRRVAVKQVRIPPAEHAGKVFISVETHGSNNRKYYHLWSTDGTSQGTNQIQDTGAVPFHCRNYTTAKVGSRLYLACFGNGRLVRLSTDASAVRQVFPKRHSTIDKTFSRPRILGVLGQKLLLSALDNSRATGNGQNLWRSDGTAVGTQPVTGIPLGVTPQGQGVVFNDRLFMLARTSATQPPDRLYATDGTRTGLVPVADIDGVFGYYRPLDNGILLERRIRQDDIGFSVRELWHTDGSSTGTTRLHSSGDVQIPVRDTTVHGGIALFSGTPTNTLWRTDGTVSGTKRIFDFSRQLPGFAATQLTSVGDAVYGITDQFDSIVYIPGVSQSPEFVDSGLKRVRVSAGTEDALYLNGSRADNPEQYDIVRISEGVATQLVENARIRFDRFEPSNLLQFGSGLIANLEINEIDATENIGPEPYLLDKSGARLLRNINRHVVPRQIVRDNGSSPGWFSYVDENTVVFSANHRLTATADGRLRGVGNEVWRTNGTREGTRLVKNIVRGFDRLGLPMGSNPKRFTRVGNNSFFVAKDQKYGRELWITDGSSAGTRMVRNITRGGDSNSFLLAALGDRLVFSVNDRTHGTELWVSDGSRAGTRLLKDIDRGPGFSSPQDFTLVGQRLFFTASDSTRGRELWVTQGTVASTRRVIDLNVGKAHSDPEYLTAFNGELYFVADDGRRGRELWRTRGTKVSTQLVVDIYPGPIGSQPRYLTAVPGALYFAAADDEKFGQIWRVTK